MRRKKSNRQRIGCETVSQAEMKASLSLCQQLETRMPIWGVLNKPCKNRSTAYLTLLSTLPSIGMGQNEVDIVLDGSPKRWGMSVLYVSAGAFIQIFHEIPKNFYCGLIPREGRDIIIANLRRSQMFRTEVKLPPIKYNISAPETLSIRGRLTILISSIPPLPPLR